MLTVESPRDLIALAGTDLGATRWLRIDQERIDSFATTTEDRQWIHVDPDRAAASPFGGTIAHGFLSLSLISHFFDQLVQVRGAGMLVNYGLNKVRFPAPVRVGSNVRGAGRLAEVRELPGGLEVVLDLLVELEGSAKPACVAAFIVRVV